MAQARPLIQTVARTLAVVVVAALGLAVTTPAGADEPEPIGPLSSWVFNNGSGSLGRATSSQYQVGFNAVARDYANGRLYATPSGVYPVTGRIFKVFVNDGGHGQLGYPTSEVGTLEGGAGYQTFQFGAVYVTPAGGFSVKGPLYAPFIARGGVDGLGLPIGPEITEGQRRTQQFERETLSLPVGHGQDSLGVRRGNMYYLKNEISPGEAHEVIAYGRAGDTVLVGDWDGDGVDTLAVRRGNVYHFKNSISSGPADRVIGYGRAEDTVMVGDWDGDGVDTLAVRRGSEYHVKNSISSGPADQVIAYGRAGDDAYPGDWLGTGSDTIAVRRGNEFHFKRTMSGGPADVVAPYGRPGDVVLVGDWDGNGTDSIAIRRGTEYHVKNSLAGGPADLMTNYGRPADEVLVGDWDGRSRTRAHSLARPTPVAAEPGVGEMSELSVAWANNSVNTTAFRKSSIVTAEAPDGTRWQFTAYYDAVGTLVLARRDRDGGDWEYSWTQHTGNVIDAHNSISLTVDGKGYLHVSWGQHGSPLTYARSVAPFSIDLTAKRGMIGDGLENGVTYPEFFRQPNGNLFFLYRNGGSGDGNVVLNRYDTSRQRWVRVEDNLINGERQRSAYWQAAVDAEGRLHLSWTWRETADVATNHDIAYARSTDEDGDEWVTASGRPYSVPIKEATAELAQEVPEESELMNQTSMTVDAEDNPYIVSYWDSGSGIVQYQVMRWTGTRWERRESEFRTTPFTLRGGGTKAVPIARPQILVTGSGDTAQVHLIIRDVDRGGVATLATLTDWDDNTWRLQDLTSSPLGEWEPSYDLDLWLTSGILDVFVQRVRQIDGEGLADFPPQFVYVFQVSPHLVSLPVDELPDPEPTEPAPEPTEPAPEPTPPVEEPTPPVDEATPDPNPSTEPPPATDPPTEDEEQPSSAPTEPSDEETTEAPSDDATEAPPSP
ncbi:BNR-4 repeat-containing protein [Georgenia phoenicis]|uniref:BNR-4 repeat-containing protein n=1 Tax=unclassified Georgenia TaxID=2626815 RepID=UPI0039AF1BA8